MTNRQQLKTLLHLFYHLAGNALVAVLLNLSIIETVVLVIFGIGIDIDHILRLIFVEKIYHPQKMYKWIRKNEAIHQPFFFIFHTIEFQILFLLFGYLTNKYIFILALAFFVHFISDAILYIGIFRSFKPWGRYFTAIGYWLTKTK